MLSQGKKPSSALKYSYVLATYFLNLRSSLSFALRTVAVGTNARENIAAAAARYAAAHIEKAKPRQNTAANTAAITAPGSATRANAAALSLSDEANVFHSHSLCGAKSAKSAVDSAVNAQLAARMGSNARSIIAPTTVRAASHSTAAARLPFDVSALSAIRAAGDANTASAAAIPSTALPVAKNAATSANAAIGASAAIALDRMT